MFASRLDARRVRSGGGPRAHHTAPEHRPACPCSRSPAGALAAVLGLVAALWACGGTSKQAPPAVPPEAAQGAAPGHAGGHAAGEDTERASPRSAGGPAPDRGAEGGGQAGAVTEAECQTLLAHVVAIAHDAHVKTVAPELAPTEEQLADIRTRMAPEFLPMCLRLDRATFECEMRAQSRDALLACVQ